MKIARGLSSARTGYRLPTEEEWEFACRAGSITSRYYGQNLDLDNHYAWTAQNPWVAAPRRSGVSNRTTWDCSTCWAISWNGATMSFAIIPGLLRSSRVMVIPLTEIVSDRQSRALRSPDPGCIRPSTVRDAAFFVPPTATKCADLWRGSPSEQDLHA